MEYLIDSLAVGIKKDLRVQVFLLSRVKLFGSFEEALFLEGADSLSAQFHLNFFAINNNGLLLKIWLPDFLGMALREADIAAVLLAFAG